MMKNVKEEMLKEHYADEILKINALKTQELTNEFYVEDESKLMSWQDYLAIQRKAWETTKKDYDIAFDK